MTHLAFAFAMMLVGDVLMPRRAGDPEPGTPSASAEGLVLRFHERVGLTVSVAGDGAVEVRLPEKMVKNPGWARSGAIAGLSMERTTDGKTVWQRRITLEPLAPVDSVLQAEPVKFRIGEGDWQSASTGTVAVHIIARSTDDKPRDITGPEAMPAVDPDKLDWRLPTLVLVALGMVALVFFVRRRERLAATPARVLEELRRLEALGLCDKGKSERHCTLLAGILRAILRDRRYGLPARRRTTEETLAAARRTEELAGQAEFLASFLMACDNAKFAPVELAPAEGRRLTASLRAWLGERKLV